MIGARSTTSGRRAGARFRSGRYTAAALLGLLAIAPSTTLARAQSGSPSTQSWPGHNRNLANTRATRATPINSSNVAELSVKWRFPLTGTGYFGMFSSSPIAVDGTIYLIDLHSTVYALDRDDGHVKWQRAFNSPLAGPNGVAYNQGAIFGTTATGAFALDADTGATLWTRELIDGLGGVDIAPQVYGDAVLVSTVPGTAAGYQPGAMGIVWALDRLTGTPKWEFNTVKDGDLWGHPEMNSGGGLWYPPAVDREGRLFLAVGNPAPFPGIPGWPNGSSRPGPNLYTNSLVALDAETGELLWYQQALPHDLRDYDLQASPIITHVRLGGIRTEIVVVAGKMGRVYAYRADDGTPLWELPVGRHENDIGPLPDDPVTVFPGFLGGVLTPMALKAGRVFVPWVDAGSQMSSTFPGGPTVPDLAQGSGGLTAVKARTGAVLWERALPSVNFGAATVANDVVFTATYDGKIYGFSTQTGEELWSTTARAGINSFPAIDGDLLLVGASAPGFFEQPVSELIAYSLD